MSAEHRRPVVAFVMLAFVTVAVIGVQRAEAQAGRLLAAMVGATVQVQGTLPAASEASREATLEQAAELGPAFAAVAGASLPRLGSERAEAATQTLAGITGTDSGAVGEAAAARVATVPVPPVVAGEERQAPPARAGHGVDKADRVVAKVERRTARTQAKADRRAARVEAKVERQLYRPATQVRPEVVRTERRAARTQAKADRRGARVEAKVERSVGRVEAKAAHTTVRAEGKRERMIDRAAVRAERAVAKLAATAGFGSGSEIVTAVEPRLHAAAHGRR